MGHAAGFGDADMIRVFPRKTNATPTDDKVYFTGPPLDPIDDVITAILLFDITFSYNIPDW